MKYGASTLYSLRAVPRGTLCYKASQHKDIMTFSVITNRLSHSASLLFPLQLDQAVKVTHEIPTAARVQRALR